MNLEVARKTLVLVPGLRDSTTGSERFHRRVAERIQDAGLPTTLYRMDWDKGGSFEEKFASLNGFVGELIQDGVTPYTGGTSLGGGAAVAAFIENPEVNAAFTVSSRLSPHEDAHGLANLRRLSTAGGEMIEWLGDNLPRLDNARRAKILTMRPMGGDENVALPVSTLPGATDHVFGFTETHDVGIGVIFAQETTAQTIVDFLSQKGG